MKNEKNTLGWIEKGFPVAEIEKNLKIPFYLKEKWLPLAMVSAIDENKRNYLPPAGIGEK